MKTYADTNFLTRLYLERPESRTAEELWLSLEEHFPVTWLTRLEVINSFQLSVLTGYGEQQQRISPEFAAVCQAQFRDDVASGVSLQFVTLEAEAWARQFEDLALRFTATHGFRTYDLLHVSAAVRLGCARFWSFDQKASKLAKLAGLQVIG
jgi:predicted nucleic acid-binding protein